MALRSMNEMGAGCNEAEPVTIPILLFEHH